MNIKLLRTIHLYLGCFFAPLLLIFIITGCLQTFNLHRSKKDGSYIAPQAISTVSQVHMYQRLPRENFLPKASGAFRFLVLMMSIGIATTTILGIVMAFKYTSPWVVWSCLIGGFLIPTIVLLIAK